MSSETFDEAIIAWSKTCPLLSRAPRLGYLGPRSGDVSVMAVDFSDDDGGFIDGTRARRLDFAIAMTLPVSGDDDSVNQSSFALTRRWMDWIDACEASGVYPDLGDGRSMYQLKNKSAAPSVVRYADNGLAKFQFFATLYYNEQ